jgi:hypothetical protein
VCPEDEGVWKSPPKDIHWQTVHKMLDEQAEKLIRVVDRAAVDKSLYIDTEGLRLYVASAERRQQFPQRMPLAYLVRNLSSQPHATRRLCHVETTSHSGHSRTAGSKQNRHPGRNPACTQGLQDHLGRH